MACKIASLSMKKLKKRAKIINLALQFRRILTMKIDTLLTSESSYHMVPKDLFSDLITSKKVII